MYICITHGFKTKSQDRNSTSIPNKPTDHDHLQVSRFFSSEWMIYAMLLKAPSQLREENLTNCRNR